MKRILGLLVILLIVGCAYTQDDIGDLVRDPHFRAYKDNLNNLESAYLRNEIAYPDYLKQKKALDDQYTKEVQKRENIIHGDPNAY